MSASGFAAATLPIGSSTIFTDAVGLIAGDASIPSGDISIPAYYARPAEGSSFPVVVVVQEIFGLHEHIRDLCRRFAKGGYLAVAPSLFDRQGDVSHMTDIPQIFTEVVLKVPDAQVNADLDAAIDWAASERGDASRLAMAGFCWGGRATWLYAAHSGRLKAGAAWYGRLEWNQSPIAPVTPIDVAGDLKSPVIGFYGGRDHSIPVEQVERMRAAIHPPSRIVLYEEAGHGFGADYRPGYDAAATQDAWQRMLDFFRENGAA
jgi:carboxymethylenebutenolidase